MLSFHTDIPTEPSCLKNRPFPSVVQSLQGLGIARPKIVTQRTHARSLHQGHGQRSEVTGQRSERTRSLSQRPAGSASRRRSIRHPASAAACCCVCIIRGRRNRAAQTAPKAHPEPRVTRNLPALLCKKKTAGITQVRPLPLRHFGKQNRPTARPSRPLHTLTSTSPLSRSKSQ